jgi:membrane protein
VLPRLWRHVKALYWKGYDDNVTGLAGMVAYNLLLSLFPLALLALFVSGNVLQSHSLETRVVADLRRLFPSATETTINRFLNHIREDTAGFGIIALVTSVWFGASFWGALDTAFCRIYHVECRKWLEQKRFAVLMLVVVLLLMCATIVVPTAESILVSGAQQLPFGLRHRSAVFYVIAGIVALGVVFLMLCIVYWAVPNRRVPWRAVWPGATSATIAVAIVDYVFPAYIAASPVWRVGTTVVFIVILLIWFYAVAIIILCGAEINAARFEIHDTGTLAAAERVE